MKNLNHVNRTFKILFFTVLLVTGLFPVSLVYATSTASSLATLDWTTLEWTSDNTSQSINWYNPWSQTGSVVYLNSVQQDYKSNTSWDWEPLSSQASYSGPEGTWIGSGATTNTSIQASIDLTAQSGEFRGSSSGVHAGFFNVTGDGNITFTINYLLSIDIAKGSALDFLQTAASAHLSLSDYAPGAGGIYKNGDAKDIYNEKILNGSLLNFQNDNGGTMSVTAHFDDNDIGDLRALAISFVWANQAPTSTVPEPTTMLLLGSGLIGLAGYGRKKFFKK
jgi:hypothetical protein